MKILLGAFENAAEADRALFELEHFGYDTQDISVISKNNTFTRQHADTTDAVIDDSHPIAEHTATGAGTGAVVGGLAGLLAGTGVMPALAGLFFAGPIGAALGIGGVAAAVVTGAASGAVAGGFIGAMTGLGVPRETAEHYDRTIKSGGILIGVTESTDKDESARDIMEKHGATNLMLLDMEMSDLKQQVATESPNVLNRRREPVFNERLNDDPEARMTDIS
jgi:hypothetical protein